MTLQLLHSLGWQIFLITSLLSQLSSLHFLCPLMFIQVSIIILFSFFFSFFPSPLLVLVVILVLIALLTLNLFYSHCIISFSFPSLAPIPSMLVPTLCSPLPPCLPSHGKVLSATHSGMAVNKRAKQKVNLSKLSLNTLPCVWCRNPGATHRSSCHRLHIIPLSFQKRNAPLIIHI